MEYIRSCYDYVIFRLIFRHMSEFPSIGTCAKGPANVGGSPREAAAIWCEVSA